MNFVQINVWPKLKFYHMMITNKQIEEEKKKAPEKKNIVKLHDTENIYRLVNLFKRKDRKVKIDEIMATENVEPMVLFPKLSAWRKELEKDDVILATQDSWLIYIKNGMVKKMVDKFRSNPGMVVAENPRLTLKEFSSMENKEKLYDQVIYKYFEMITRGSQVADGDSIRSYAMSAHSWSLISSSHQFGDIPLYPEEINLTDYDVIFWPTCIRGHWTLSAFSQHSKRIDIFNSLDDSSYNPKAKKLTRFFAAELQKRGSMVTEDQIKVRQPKCPQQTNSFDCGVFVCEFARRLVRGESLRPDSFTQEDVTNYYRPKMVVEILEDSLCD